MIKLSDCFTKTYLYNLDPLKPDFYIVKRGFQGYTLFFLFLLINMDCKYSLEPPRRGGPNEYSQSMFWAEIWKISEFLSENFHFLMVKFSVYLNRRLVDQNRTVQVLNGTCIEAIFSNMGTNNLEVLSIVTKLIYYLPHLFSALGQTGLR